MDLDGALTWFAGHAGSLGFDRVGFAPLDEAWPEEAERFREWLAAGMAGEMAWLERTAARRSDPRRLVADARSVAVLAVWYSDAAPAPPGQGSVARYARGRDYHNTLGRRLRKLLRACRERWPQHDFYGSVDTGAVLEKAWAARAGLGWIGKNTLLLTPGAGSYQLLAAVVLPFPAPAPAAVTDGCAGCRLCLDACPTQAFPAPYVLDARRCVSYLTIELRGDIPIELRSGVGDRLFGCDACQEVCPVNTRPPLPSQLPTAADAGLHEPLPPWLDPPPDEVVAELLRGRPLARAGRDGMVRNACVVAGNSGDRRWVEPLAGLLRDRSRMVRRHAAWALGQLGGAAAEGALRRSRDEETDPATRAALDDALGGPAGAASTGSR